MALPREEMPGLESFLCAHLTPELLRQQKWLDHPNGACRINGIHVLVENTDALIEAYDRLFGIQHVTTTDAVICVRVGRHRIVFSTPDDFVTMHPAIDIDPGSPRFGIVSLELGVASCAVTARHFARAKIAFDEMPDGSLAVPASAATGAVLFFAET